PLEANRSLRYLWARTRIARLSDFNFYPAHYENTAEITSLGLTYNLLTAYTSFIAVNDVIVNQEGDAEDVDQPQPLPLNVSNQAVGGTVSAVPEPELFILLTMAAMLLSMVLVIKKYRMKGDHHV
ncbi:MAG: trypsin, partial [Deltaproteobacteria bacterium]|nr:trypsin [Deltaproteobacteria bacterium]